VPDTSKQRTTKKYTADKLPYGSGFAFLQANRKQKSKPAALLLMMIFFSSQTTLQLSSVGRHFYGCKEVRLSFLFFTSALWHVLPYISFLPNNYGASRARHQQTADNSIVRLGLCKSIMLLAVDNSFRATGQRQKPKMEERQRQLTTFLRDRADD